jgi:type II secretion system protein C
MALAALVCVPPLGADAADRATVATASRPAASVERAAPAAGLRVTGIVTSTALTRAIIAGPGTAQRTYRSGDALPDGSTLGVIGVDRVVVRRDGVERVVGLEWMDASAPVRLAAPRGPSSPPSAAAGRTGRSAAAAVRANPVLLLDLLPFEAVMDRQRMVALKLGTPSDPSLMQELKLVSGDVLTAINGVELNGPDQRAWMQSEAGPAQALTLKVYRDGRTETLRY